MKTLGILLFLVLLTLCTELPSASGQNPGPRNCPPDPYVCVRAEPNECEDNRICPKTKICCQNRCAKRCVVPVRGKPGLCPYVPKTCRARYPPNKCNNDYNCEEEKKCCEGRCGKECVPPVFV
ncbi:antileukoproteinase-like [Elgaria multicarinata webbii]|uniref:antileukoproteinase-like n=1 Tax=Elgaria multicarinata webbii TaxID=159646 RepID=UPI002FCD62B8